MALWKRSKTQGEPVDTTEAGRTDDVIDLREPSSATPGFGCPECEGPGFLESIDLRKGVQHMRCRQCGSRWETTEALPASG